MCGQPKQFSYKPCGFLSLPGPAPVPALFLLDGVTGNRGNVLAKTPMVPQYLCTMNKAVREVRILGRRDGEIKEMMEEGRWLCAS